MLFAKMHLEALDLLSFLIRPAREVVAKSHYSTKTSQILLWVDKFQYSSIWHDLRVQFKTVCLIVHSDDVDIALGSA